MIFVTKSFLPPKAEYLKYIERIYESGQLTNNGPLVQELEKKISAYLQSPTNLFCSNGTIVLQLALKALLIKKEVITTPFSYVATTNAIIWENCSPVFVDINTLDFNVDVNLIEEKITSKTEALLFTHVFGNPCDVEKIELLAKKYNLKVIYDAAHAFGVKYRDRSIFCYGDISTCSYHATKIFHTIEGGGVFSEDDAIIKQLSLHRSFGHIYDDYYTVGINAKNSEFHAAMGLCNINHLASILQIRKDLCSLYDGLLKLTYLKKPSPLKHTEYNYSYYPILLNTEAQLLRIVKKLNEKSIFPRRYFYPSLNTLPFLKEKQICRNSEDISKRILCLPLYVDLSKKSIMEICEIINSEL